MQEQVSGGKKTFSTEIAETLIADGLYPQMPLETRSKLTLVLKHLDRFVVDQSEETIKKEIESHNKDHKVDNVYIMKTSYMIKIRLVNHQMAKN